MDKLTAFARILAAHHCAYRMVNNNTVLLALENGTHTSNGVTTRWEREVNVTAYTSRELYVWLGY